MIASGRFSQEQIDKLVEYSGAVAESKNKIEQGNNALKLLNATSGQHVEVTADSIKQLTIQTNLTKVATQNFTDMKTQMLDSLRAQVEFIKLNGGSEEQVKSLNKVIQAYSLNQMAATDAVGKFNSTAKVPADTIKGLQDYATKTDQSKTALNQANAELNKQKELRDSYLKQHQSVLAAQQGETNEVNNQVAAQEKLNKLRESYGQRNLEADFITLNTKRFGGDKAGLNKASAVTEFYKENKIPMTRSLTDDEWKIFEKFYNKQVELKKLQDDINDTEKEGTKESEKQTKDLAKRAVLLAGNDEKLRNMLRVYQAFRNAGAGDKQARVMTAQVGRENDFRKESMFGSHKDANNGYTNTGFISWQKERSTELMKFLQGQGLLDKNGQIQWTQDALDAQAKFFMQEVSTKKEYKATKNALSNDDLSYREMEKTVSQNYVRWDYEGKKLGKGKASQHLAKQDSYYNQLNQILGTNPEAVSRAIGEVSKFEDEAYKARAKTLEEIKQLQTTYDSESVLRNKQREDEINKATVLGQLKLIPKINERFDAEDKLAQKQFDFEVNGYKWTEEQKLEYTYETNSLRLVAEGKLSEDQRKIALNSLKLQKQQELALVQLAQEQRAFQARLSLLSETQAMQERYRLEREEILQNTKLSIEERQKLIALSKATQDKETRDKVNNAVQNWGGIQADMNGSSEFYRQDQERFSRLGAANDLADSQYAATDLNEQSGLDSLNAQMEAGLIQQQDFENQKTAIIQAAQEQRSQIYNDYAQNVKDVEDKYQQDRLNAQIALGGQMMGSVTSMFGSMFGEQSKAYKLMFAADKAYAIAAAGIAIQQNIAAAAKVGFPYNLPLIAGAVAQGASIIANIRAIKDQGFADGGYTGSGGKYDIAGAVHKGEIVWSQDDIKKWGGVEKVEQMRRATSPDSFISNYAQNNTSFENVMNRANQSSRAFNQSRDISNIFNQSYQDDQIIYKGNANVTKPATSANSDLFHDGKVYFSSNGLVQDRSNLDDVQDFTLGQSSRPQAEFMPSIEPSSPTINFKIEVVNQVSGAAVEAEQLDEKTVRIIVREELDKQLPRAVPKLVSEDIKNPNSTISRSLTENTTARRNRM